VTYEAVKLMVGLEKIHPFTRHSRYVHRGRPLLQLLTPTLRPTLSSFPRTRFRVTHVILRCELMVHCDMSMRSVDVVPQRISIRSIGRTPWRIPVEGNERDGKGIYPSKFAGLWIEGVGQCKAGGGGCGRNLRGDRSGHTRSAPYGDRQAQYTDIGNCKQYKCYRRVESSVRRGRKRAMFRSLVT